MAQAPWTKWFRLREGWLTVGLVALLLFSVIWAVQRAGWSDQLFILTPITLAGLGTALLLSRLRGVPRLLLHLTGTTAGVVLILWQNALLLDDPRLITIQDRVQDLLIRLFLWTRTVMEGGTSDDGPLFVLALAAVAWLLAYSTTWFVFRSRALWWAIIPNAVALVVNISYSASSLEFFFALFVLTALVLMVQCNLLVHEERWERERVNYTPSIRSGFLRAALGFAVVATLLMGLIPRPAGNETLNRAWNAVNGPWEALQERWSNAFAGVSGTGTFGYSTFNDAFTLGTSLNLGDGVAMRIKTSGENRLYWRAKTYDYFNGQGWSTTDDRTFNNATRSRTQPPSLILDANQPLQISDGFRAPVTATVQMLHPRSNIVFVPLRPAQVNIPTKLDVSWQRLSNFYLVPGTDPADAPIELQPLLNLLADARREALSTYSRDPANPSEGGAPLPPGSPEAVAQAVLVQIGREGNVAAQWTQLRDRGITVRYSLTNDFTFRVEVNGIVPEYDDLRAIYSTTKMPANQEYTVVSEISVAAKDDLRRAGRNYPGWVQDRYLELPPTLPARVHDKALEVTAGATNDYDRAAAIESYLRSFHYSTKIARPPVGRDFVDWFLFDTQEGYCEHYSSAMVVMLRTLGIPAREASGFAPGDYDPATGEWTIRESAAHAWPEVYFPNAGWVQFEPTPSQMIIQRPDSTESGDAALTPTVNLTPAVRPTRPIRGDEEDTPTPVPDAATTTGSDDGSNGAGGLWVLLGLFVVLAVAGGLWLREQLRRQAVASGRLVLGGLQYYERLLRVLPWLGFRTRPSDTPFEFAEGLSRDVPGSREYVTPIAQAYVRERYGRHRPDIAEQQSLAQAWAGLRNRLVRHLSSTRLPFFRRR